jgi:hypothetical protein
VTLGIATPLGGGLERETHLFFDFPSGIPSPDPWPETEFALPDPAALASAANIYLFDLDTIGGVTNAVRLITEITSISFVPEPAAGLTLLAGALVALGVRRRRCA